MGRERVFDIDDEFNLSDHSELEREWKKSVQKDLDEFASEYAEGNEDEVLKARKEYLERKIEGLEFKKSEIENRIAKCEGEVWQWFGDMIRENELPVVERKIRKLQRELNMLVAPPSEQDQNGISDAEIEAAKNRDCADFVEIKRNGGQIQWALCVFHNDTNPSMACYPGEKGFYCFACNEGGDVIKLVQKVHNCTFPEAIRIINSS